MCYSFFKGAHAGKESTDIIDVINDTDQKVNIDLKVPARAEALIKIKKLHGQQPQEMLHKAILNNSAEEVRNAVLAGADVNNGKDGKLPLLWALLLKCCNAFEALV